MTLTHLPFLVEWIRCDRRIWKNVWQFHETRILKNLIFDNRLDEVGWGIIKLHDDGNYWNIGWTKKKKHLHFIYENKEPKVNNKLFNVKTKLYNYKSVHQSIEFHVKLKTENVNVNGWIRLTYLSGYPFGKLSISTSRDV